MQLIIDISAESSATLRLASSFLLDHASLRDLIDGRVPTGTRAPAGSTATETSAPVAASPTVPLPPPLPATAQSVPPAPVAPVSAAPASATVTPIRPATDASTGASVVTQPNVQTMSPDHAPAPTSLANVFTDLSARDKSGVPFDSRIHQDSRKTKADGTWKLKKKIDSTFVEAVMRQLAPHIGTAPTSAPTNEPDPSAVFGNTPAPVGASAPVTLPPVPPAPGAQIVPPPPVTSTQAVPPPAGQGQVDPWRALVAKISQNKAAKKITHEEVMQCLANAGVPSLQLLNNMPHKIGEVESFVDAILVTRE